MQTSLARVSKLRLFRYLCGLGTSRFLSTAMAGTQKLRIGYVPEHFATPLHFAMDKFGLDQHATLTSFPSGTGTMIEAFYAKEIDVGIGLTEAWVTGLSKVENGKPFPYHIVGSYTLSPLLWAISTGGKRTDVNNVAELRNKKVGISRIGSGSQVMASVLAQTHGWLKPGSELPFEVVVCGPFAPLREAVNNSKADFFMWEHFTSKKFYDDGTLKRVGEIETPWNGWNITSSLKANDPRIKDILLPALDKGVLHFEQNLDESADYISSNMEYSKEDAKAWYKTVKFPSSATAGIGMGGYDEKTIQKTIDILRTAGVLGSGDISVETLKA